MTKLFSKRLTIFCCILMSLLIVTTSMLSVMAVTSADYSVKLTTTNSAEVQSFVTDNVSNNLLSGLTPVFTADSGTSSPSHTTWDALTEGVYTTTRRLTVTTSKSNTAAKITYSLGKNVKLKNVLVVCRENNYASYGLSYEVYLSDEESELYNSNNKVFSTSDGNYPSGGQLITFKDNCVLEGKYVGFRIFGGYNYGYHIAELGVYGEQNAILPTVNQTTTNSAIVEQFVSENNNLLANIIPIMSADSGTVSSNTNTWSILNDGAYGNNSKRITLTTSKNNTAVNLTYALKKSTQITNFLIVCRDNNHSLYGLEYELYISKDLNNLYSASNKVFVKNNTDYSEGGQLLTFSDEIMPTGNFVGIRFIGGYNYGYHIAEIGVYGEELAPMPEVKQTVTNKTDVEAFISNNLANNLLVGVTPSVTEEGTNVAVSNVDTGWHVLTDGSYTTRKSFFETGRGTGKFRLTYSLPYRVSISEILIVCRENNPSSYGLQYEIYVGDNAESLYEKENLIFTNSNDYKEGGQLIIMPEENKSEGYYIGFRLLNAPNKYHLGEIGVWGQKVKDSTPYNVLHTVPNLSEIETQIKEENLLKDIEPTLYDCELPDQIWKQEINNTEEGSWISVGGKWSNLTDGILFVEPKRRVDIIQGRKLGGLHLTYVLNEVTEIDNIVMVGMWASFGDYCTQGYKIYVSDTLEDLYDGSNLVINYYNDQRYDAGVKYSGAGQMYVFNEKPIGKYFGIKFTYENNTDEMVRLDEIGVYGTPVSNTEKNLVQNKPFDCEQSISASDLELLTNGTLTDDVEIKTNGNDFDIVYDLSKKMLFDEVSVVTANSSLIKSLKIYAADSKEEIYNNSSLVKEFKEEQNSESEIKIKFEETLNRRYVRFLIEEYTGNNIHLAEISVKGSSLQDLHLKNILKDLGDSNISAWLVEQGVPITFDEEQKVVLEDGVSLEKIIDGDKKSSIDLYTSNDNQTIDIVFKLKNLKVITDFQFDAFEKNPEKIEYYIGNTITELFEESTKPCATLLTSEKEELEHQISIIPTIGAFIRVSITPSNDKGTDENKKISISDISVNGYYIEGFLDSSGDKNVLKTFIDNDTGTKIQIKKLYSNDIWSDIQKMVVKKRTPNIYENSKLNGMLLKVYDAMYDIYFYDSDNNRITDLGERSMYVSLKMPKDQSVSYMAQSDEKDIWILNATYNEDELYYLLPSEEITYSFGIAVYDTTPSIEDEEQSDDLISSEDNNIFEDVESSDNSSIDDDRKETVKSSWTSKIGLSNKNVPKSSKLILKTSPILLGILGGVIFIEIVIAGILLIIKIKKKK